MQISNVTAFFFIGFLILGGLASLWAFSGVSLTKDGLFNGRLSSAVETDFDDHLPHRPVALDGWNIANKTLFEEGRKGVVIGEDGWLFSDEEFTWPQGADEQLQENLRYIAEVAETLQIQDVKLLVIPVPAKARLYQAQLGERALPFVRRLLYPRFAEYMVQADVAFAETLSAFESQKREPLYFKNDTHWRPEGARVAAMVAYQSVTAIWPYFSWEQQTVKSERADKPETHEGDLTRYTVKTQEEFYPWTTQVESAGDDLFGDQVFDIALVGTSYSANPLWNFDGFLKDVFQADILNVADEGLGPFAVMRNYLESEAYKSAPPKLVLWEIPERYLPLKPEGK